nr:cyclase family protein [Hyphomicrobiales bacterium]
VHWITGKDYQDGTTDRLPVQKLVGPVNVIDCSRETAADEDFLLSADGVRAWEREHGDIKAGSWVVMRTGWHPRNRSEAEFLNVRDNMPHSPGPTVDCIEYLIGKGIVGWGTETVGTDAGKAGGFDPPYPAHNLLHKNNRYGLASLANLDKLPPKGAILIAAPLKFVAGTGSPIRALALVPRG